MAETTPSPPDAREVPAYRCEEFRPLGSRYCVTVFVLNEGPRIQRQLERMRPWIEEVDIIIADGGSTDGALPPSRLREQGVSALLVKTGPGRLAAQMRMAYSYALDRGHEGIISMDGNDKDDPEGLRGFIEALDAGCDHVQGSRFVPGGRGLNTPLSRLLAVRFIHAPLISLAARFRYTDTTNGFRAYSARLLHDPRVAPFRSVFVGYELHYYLAVRAARLGYSVREVPVTRRYPPGGKVPTKISLVRGNLMILAALGKTCLAAHNPRPNDSARVEGHDA